MRVIHQLFQEIKNIPGWKTKRKLVAIAVDDYGNVRLDSKKAYEAIHSKNPVKEEQRFDRFDTLETREDLEMLYEILASVKDQHGNPAIFTPFALPCNIDFERLRSEGFEKYQYELLPETFKKLEANQPIAYRGTWDLWNEGMKKGLMLPQFHGREHFNLKVFEEKLAKKDPALLLSLKNRSLANIGPSDNPFVRWTAAFSFWDPAKDIEKFPEILQDGMESFKKVYGYKPSIFTPPANAFPNSLERFLVSLGIIAVNRAFFESAHVGFGKYKRRMSTLRLNKEINMIHIVRNVVFEPTCSNINHVEKALSQIETAFKWNKPAIISSHRVNFCGHIDANNRKTGLTELKKLLSKIVNKWPDVEFKSIKSLTAMMTNG